MNRIGQKTYPVPLLFLAILEPTFLWLTAAAVRRRAAAITRNFFAATGNFQARVQCFLKLPCFLPQKQGVSGAEATETTMFQGERVVGHACCLEVCKTSRLFRKENEHTACAVPAGTNFLRSGKFQKDLILFVRSCCFVRCFEVHRTSKLPAQEYGLLLFALCKK